MGDRHEYFSRCSLFLLMRMHDFNNETTLEFRKKKKKPRMYNARCAVVEKCLSGGDPEFPLEMPLPCWS